MKEGEGERTEGRGWGRRTARWKNDKKGVRSKKQFVNILKFQGAFSLR